MATPGRLLLKSGRPQTATGFDHGHQGLAGCCIIQADTSAHTHRLLSARTLWMQIAELKVATQGGYQCAGGADTWSWSTGNCCQGRTRFTLVHILWGRALCPVITPQTALISHRILASTKTLPAILCTSTSNVVVLL